jgi:hypothetical protein
MMLHENSEVVLIMVCRDIWLEYVESIPIEKADKLNGRLMLILRSRFSAGRVNLPLRQKTKCLLQYPIASEDVLPGF